MTAVPPDDEILAALEAELVDIDQAPTDVVNLQDLTVIQLLARRKILTDRLTSLGEIYRPRSREAMEIHAELDLIRLDLNRRKHAG